MLKRYILPVAGGLLLAATTALNVFQRVQCLRQVERAVQLEERNKKLCVDQHQTYMQTLREQQRLQDIIKYLRKDKTFDDELNELDRVRQLESESERLEEQYQNLLHFDTYPSWDDIPDFTDKDIQMILTQCLDSDLAIAMKYSSAKVRQAVYRNISQRTTEKVNSDMEYLQGEKPCEVRLAKARISGNIRRLISESVILVIPHSST